MLTVACVWKAGKIYNEEDVNRLCLDIANHLPGKYRLVCLSDMTNVACEWISLTQDWRGWWSKMELFKLEPPVLYFDLDTIITGDLSDLAAAAQREPFIMLRDFYREKGLGSGVMAWSIDMRPTFQKFAKDAYGFMDRYRTRGDQAFLEDHAPKPVARWQDLLPGQICSYKADNVRDRGVPQNCRAVCFHGNPKPRDIGWDLFSITPSAA